LRASKKSGTAAVIYVIGGVVFISGGVAILVLGEAANRTLMYLAAALIIGYGVWVIVRTLRRR